jgi:hypothetical protein
MLADHGVMLLHTIGRMSGPGATDAFTRKYIFPGGYIPALSETLAASERSRLIAADVENLRLHYALTLRQWYARCVERKAEIIALHGARFYRMWTFYLAGATAAFESGSMCNYQIQYVRNRRNSSVDSSGARKRHVRDQEGRSRLFGRPRYKRHPQVAAGHLQLRGGDIHRRPRPGGGA